MTVETRAGARPAAAGRGWLRHVCVDAETWEKTPMPDWVREALGRYAVT